MGLVDQLFGKNKVIPSSARFRITEEGREQLQDFDATPESRILLALETHGSSNVDTIASVGKVNRGSVEKLIPGLVRRGCVQYVNAHSGDGMGGADD